MYNMDLNQTVEAAAPAGGFDILGGIGSALNIAGGLFSTGYDMWRQNKQWEREDTAMQRRVADLKAAGLSPVLAAGGGGAASSAISVKSAPDFNQGVVSALATRKAMADISQTEEQTRLISNQRFKVAQENALLMNTFEAQSDALLSELKAKLSLTESAVERAKLDNQIKEIEARREKKALDYYDADKIFQYGGAILGAAKDFVPFFKGKKLPTF